MILFYFIVYFVIPMMFWVDMPLRSYVVIEPYYAFWHMELPILFIYLVIMLL